MFSGQLTTPDRFSYHTGTVRSGGPGLGIYFSSTLNIYQVPERAFRYLLSNQPERFVLSVPALTCNGPKKVIQNFAEEETRNFPEIIKTGHFEIFPGALRHFRIYVYTTVTANMMGSIVELDHLNPIN